jgi:GTP-binding protein HflX
VLTAAFVGYTNAGKSSLLSALAKVPVFIEDRLFATLDTLTREADIGGGQRVRLIDTVGFIRKLPHHLVASFRATLEEAGSADVLIHVIDISHPYWQDQVAVVEEVIAGLGFAARPVIHAFNKIDLVPDAAAMLESLKATYERAVGVSAATGQFAPLIEELRASARRLPTRGAPQHLADAAREEAG